MSNHLRSIVLKTMANKHGLELLASSRGSNGIGIECLLSLIWPVQKKGKDSFVYAANKVFDFEIHPKNASS